MTLVNRPTDSEPLSLAGDREVDVVGVGIGPFNLSLAALAEPLRELDVLLLDAKPRFTWHPGLLLEGTRLQVPFLADLVTMVDPTSRWSFLSYLREHDRLFPFYFTERFHVARREYDAYCRWVAGQLPSCRFGARVDALRWDAGAGRFAVEYTGSEGTAAVRARHVVLGVGTEPIVPPGLAHLTGDRVFHTAEYLDRLPGLTGARDVTVIGSGQSGAEVFLDLMHRAPETGWHVTWLTSAPGFVPMEYSKLGLEHFTPDYTRFFRTLSQELRDRVVPSQWQLYKAISADTLADIFDLLYDRTIDGGDPGATLMPVVTVESAAGAEGRLELRCRHEQQRTSFVHRTDAVALATGYTARRPAFLAPVEHLVEWDEQGRYRVDDDYRVAMAPTVTGSLFVQNAEEHTHGVGTPDLGLGAWRSATILNALTGGSAYRLPQRTAFTQFGVPDAANPAVPPRPASGASEAVRVR